MLEIKKIIQIHEYAGLLPWETLKAGIFYIKYFILTILSHIPRFINIRP
jgi:hypothetical protein